jgi:hypothetical protein
VSSDYLLRETKSKALDFALSEIDIQRLCTELEQTHGLGRNKNDDIKLRKDEGRVFNFPASVYYMQVLHRLESNVS